MTLQTHAEPYRHGPVALTGHFAWNAEQPDRRPGVLVVHGGAGLDEHARRQTARLAELGFVAFACDLYGDGIVGDRSRVMAAIQELRSDTAFLRARAEAGLAQLAAHPLLDGRIAAVGYCFGGMTVLELARAGAALSGVASIHGSLDTAHRAQPGAVKAKVLVCHGGLDAHVPFAHVSAFTEEMNTAGADYQLIVYGGALHGFTHEGASPLPGVAYHAPTAARSWQALRSFLGEVFGAAFGTSADVGDGPLGELAGDHDLDDCADAFADQGLAEGRRGGGDLK